LNLDERSKYKSKVLDFNYLSNTTNEAYLVVQYRWAASWSTCI